MYLQTRYLQVSSQTLPDYPQVLECTLSHLIYQICKYKFLGSHDNNIFSAFSIHPNTNSWHKSILWVYCVKCCHRHEKWESQTHIPPPFPPSPFPLTKGVHSEMGWLQFTLHPSHGRTRPLPLTPTPWYGLSHAKKNPTISHIPVIHHLLPRLLLGGDVVVKFYGCQGNDEWR